MLKLLTIIFPCTLKRLQPQQNREERLKLINIFTENNQRSRKDFFDDPMIQFLWSNVFIKENPDLVTSQLKSLKSEQDLGAIKVERFIISIQQLEEQHQIRFLPLGANAEKIEQFAPEEEYQFLLKNGKYNKRNRMKINSEIRQLDKDIKKKR